MTFSNYVILSFVYQNVTVFVKEQGNIKFILQENVL